ncbi:histidine phosphatase family protein [Agrococcus casei]|uniref:Hypothetical, related to broad specificity phosphatases COG0406 n=2 Tax=Agrococcus TaxID=46352 RepID=A0A1R4G9I0_9MICO|nr:histidine phosphatase family protein [Agrococcus casei]SJM64844.1 Hypothetical, related to broad specificity phosphatases COG0406 [Agrococcus casei LMG 22410]
MPATRLHLVRHGEVHNPDGILYGRIPGYRLSERGERMAQVSAESMTDAPIVRLYASPLERAQQSAQPWSEQFGLEAKTETRIIEPWNKFEGGKFDLKGALLKPSRWHLIRNPFEPSWGEAYDAIAQRVIAAMEDAWDELDESGETGEIVMVCHQSPIWMAHLAIAGQRLWHDPRTRRCDLSSITSFERRDGRFAEVAYADPAANIDRIDTGAV